MPFGSNQTLRSFAQLTSIGWRLPSQWCWRVHSCHTQKKRLCINFKSCSMEVYLLAPQSCAQAAGWRLAMWLDMLPQGRSAGELQPMGLHQLYRCCGPQNELCRLSSYSSCFVFFYAPKMTFRCVGNHSSCWRQLGLQVLSSKLIKDQLCVKCKYFIT